jgi:tetratricopeptide (TPR) repeat protein
MSLQLPETSGGPSDAASSSGTAETALPATLASLSRELDRSAAAVLQRLAATPGEPVSKDALLEAGWPGRIIHENSLAKAIGRIRSALDAHEGYALTAVYGQGYQLNCPALADAAQSPASPPAPAPTPMPAPWWRRAAPWLALGGIVGAIGMAALYLRPAPAPAPAPQESREAAALMAFISEDLILPTDPYAEVPANPELRGVVERTAETMDERFAGQPGALMALNILLAKAFSGWGEYDRAVLHLAAAREQALTAFGDADQRLVEIDALTCQQMRLAGQTREAEKTCLAAAERGEGLQSPHRFMALVNLGKIQFEVGDYAAAVASLDRVLARPADVAGEIVADALWFRGLALRKLARFAAAERDFVAHVEARAALNGIDHPLTGWAHSDYGDFLAYIGEHDRARAELARAQAIFDRRLGPDHVEAQSPAYSIALIHLDRGEPERAAAILAPVVDNFARSLGRDHFWTAYAMTELAIARAMLGQKAEARALLREAQTNAASELFGRPAKSAWLHLRWGLALGSGAGVWRWRKSAMRRARAANWAERARISSRGWAAITPGSPAPIASARGSSRPAAAAPQPRPRWTAARAGSNRPRCPPPIRCGASLPGCAARPQADASARSAAPRALENTSAALSAA